MNKFKCPQKIVSILLTLILLLSIMAVAPITAGALETYGDWDYILVNGDAYICYYNGSSNNIVIPSTIGANDYNVVGIGFPGYDDYEGLFECNYEYGDVNGDISITIPEGVLRIDYNAFNCNMIAYIGYISIPSTVNYLDESAICNNPSLSRIDFYSTTTTIDSSAFYYNSALKIYCYNPSDIRTFAINNGINYETLSDEPAASPESDFDFNSGTGTITRYKGSDANIIIPDTIGGVSVTAIGNNAFAKSCIESITIPASVSSIGNAFYSCQNLTSLTVKSGNQNFSSEDGVLYNAAKTTLVRYPIKKTGAVSFPNTVTSVDNYAFYKCSGVTSITIPNNITSIGSSAFAEASLTSATLNNNLTSLGEYAFQQCRSLSSVNIPSGITEIPRAAFMSCALTSVTIPNNITAIGNDAFNGNGSLTSVTLSNNLTSIGEYAFQNCYNITSITFPESLTTIGYAAFERCRFTNIVIPNSVTTLDYDAFRYCNNLESVTLGKGISSIPTDYSDPFSYCNNLETIYGYVSTAADTYASDKSLKFIPLLNTNTGSGYADAPLDATQSKMNDDTECFGLTQDTYNSIELLGVQQKSGEENTMRFVAVINEGFIKSADEEIEIDDYGFVLAKCSATNTSTAGEANISTITLDSNITYTASCKNTYNEFSGDYGDYKVNTKYKYVTLALKNVPGSQSYVVRFYIKTKSGRVYYADYHNAENQTFTGCVASYDALSGSISHN